MHFQGIQRAMGAPAVRRIQAQMVQHVVDGVARPKAIVGVAQMSVIVDPLRLDVGAVDRKLRYCRGARHWSGTQRSCSFSRACAGVSTRAPMASMMVRAFSPNWALLAYTPLLK